MSRRIPRPSLETTVACVALLTALGGTAAAVTQPPRASVGTVHLRNDAVTSPKVRNGSLRALDVAAGQAASGPAGPKGDKGERGVPGEQGTRGPSDAYTRSVAGPVTIVPGGVVLTRVASLDLPRAGAYVIWAKTNVDVTTVSADLVHCELRSETSSVNFEYVYVGTAGVVAAQLMRDVSGPEVITFACAVSDRVAFATRARITALRVATLSG